MEALTWIGIFLISLFVLIKSSDYFTDIAEKIGLYFGIPQFIVGVTIVSIGTSLPELASSLFAQAAGNSEIIAGNVVGSNIANILLVLGVAAIIGRRMKISWELMHVDSPLLIISAFLIWFMLRDGLFTLPEGVICILGYIIYVHYTLTSQKTHKSETKVKKPKLQQMDFIILALSVVGIYYGAKYTIDAVVSIATLYNIGADIVAISAVSIGTSLPELMVSVVAARKGKAELAVGNVLGSNIFNSFMVLGIPSLFGSIVVGEQLITFALPVMLAATFMYLFSTQIKEVTRWEGWMFLLFYVFFIARLFGLF